jgi:hypothetical protein
MKGWACALKNLNETTNGIAKKLKREIPIKDGRDFNLLQATEVRNRKSAWAFCGLLNHI